MNITEKKYNIEKMIPKLNKETCYRILKYIVDNKIIHGKNARYYLINLKNCNEKQIDDIYNIIFIDKYEPLKQNAKPNIYSWLDKIAI